MVGRGDSDTPRDRQARAIRTYHCCGPHGTSQWSISSGIPLRRVSWNVSRLVCCIADRRHLAPAPTGMTGLVGASMVRSWLPSNGRPFLWPETSLSQIVFFYARGKIILSNLSEGFLPSSLAVWCGHPPGVVTTSGCAPTPRVQHQASGPHVGYPPHRPNSSRSLVAPLPTLHIVPRVSHLLAVRGPLASFVTVHCLRQHDFIPTGPGQHKTWLPLLRHVARASFDVPRRCLR